MDCQRTWYKFSHQKLAVPPLQKRTRYYNHGYRNHCRGNNRIGDQTIQGYYFRPRFLSLPYGLNPVRIYRFNHPYGFPRTWYRLALRFQDFPTMGFGMGDGDGVLSSGDLRFFASNGKELAYEVADWNTSLHFPPFW